MSSINEAIIKIAPKIQGHVTPIDLINSISTFTFALKVEDFDISSTGLLFSLSYLNYILELGILKGILYLRRNRDIVNLNIIGIKLKTDDMYFAVIWHPNHLKIIMINDDKLFTREKQTDYILPPNGLIKWARKNGIIPTKKYTTKEEFYETVTSSMQLLYNKILESDSFNILWDINYKGNRIISRKPKKEIDIHSFIHAMLLDMALAKNLEIQPESQIGQGSLDFLITGILKNNDFIHTCIEFKHAHNKNLIKGLTLQLPYYMRSKDCEYGLYVVMYFKCNDFNKPKGYDINELEKYLHGIALSKGLENIRILMYNFSDKPSPSKLEDDL
jgi:hypothetical protein